MKGVIYVEIDKCVACKTCEIHCAIEHSKSKTLCKAILEYPLPQGRIKVESEAGYNIPLQCRQCEDAPCTKVCPSKAIQRLEPNQPVLIDPKLCIGCKMCILACPFGVIKMDDAGKAVLRCDMCFERLQKGDLPACVAACPTKALKFKTLEEISEKKRKDYLVNITKKQDK
ncbi:MAG: 4Fe-4S dicluster domain-containing protein [Candidatus Omnitrophota bacterium]